MHVECSPELCVRTMKVARDITIRVLSPQLEVVDPREGERSWRRQGSCLERWHGIWSGADRGERTAITRLSAGKQYRWSKAMCGNQAGTIIFPVV